MVESKIPYVIRRTGESSFSAELTRRAIWRKRKHVIFFERYGGKVIYDVENPENSEIEMVVEAEGAVCRDPSMKPVRRKEFAENVRATFLEAGQHPEIRFRSEQIKSITPYRFRLQGPLTLRGITAPAVFEATVVSGGKERMEVDASGTIRLTDYGITPPSSLMGMVRVSDSVRLRILLWPERSSG
jgi:polyisoprenoid-binding protein YceI